MTNETCPYNALSPFGNVNAGFLTLRHRLSERTQRGLGGIFYEPVMHNQFMEMVLVKFFNCIQSRSHSSISFLINNDIDH